MNLVEARQQATATVNSATQTRLDRHTHRQTGKGAS